VKYVRTIIAATLTLGAAATISLTAASAASADTTVDLCGTCWYSSAD
jgi:hypothetical protein